MAKSKRKRNNTTDERLFQMAYLTLLSMAHDNQFITSDTLIANLSESGYVANNYSFLGIVFRRAAEAGAIEISPHKNKSKSHSAKTVWRSKVYEND